MGFLSNLMDKGRGPRIEKDMEKVAPIVSQLRNSARNAEFASVLFVTMRKATAYAANMTRKGQRSYGMQLQITGLRNIDQQMLIGSAIWMAGSYIEANATNTQACADLRDFFFDLIKECVSHHTPAGDMSANAEIPDEILVPAP